MDSPRSVVSPFKRASVFAEFEKQTADLFHNSPGFLSRGIHGQRKDTTIYNAEDSVGALEVFLHQARDIHNICIYHKQDVYAKLCLTSDPENAVSSKIINGGGKNPIFNDNLRINVRTLDTSLKCEIWMLSRVRNYLEDQLLGFTLVPLSEVLAASGKLEKEFTLSSTDLFHSPAGFVHLSLAFHGDLPEVLTLSSLSASIRANEALHGGAPGSFPSELDKIEFPDPKVLCENHLMVSECFGIPCAGLISQRSGSCSFDTEDQLHSEAGVQLVESFSAGTASPVQFSKHDSPPSSGSAYVFPSASKSSKDNYGSYSEEIIKDKNADVSDTRSTTSENQSDGSYVKPILTVNLEQEQKVVQQDIVDMYMKSMQQFTESLAKMKLPLDIDNKPTCSGDSSSDHKLPASKNSGNRVFYGSRAFF